MSRLKIGRETITQDSDAYVIAEIGHNHGGSLTTATQMCIKAKSCGVDAVKFQKRTNTKIYTKRFLATPYNSEHAFGATYKEHREALEFGFAEFTAIDQFCKDIDLDWFATAFDIDSVDFLCQFDIAALKVASGDLTNTPLIEHMITKQKPIILSTLGANWEDMWRAYNLLAGYEPGFAFLHCTPYKTRPEEVNLRAIENMLYAFQGTIIGISSHFNGPRAAADAYYKGARIVEQHFTLDRTAKGSDHCYSLEPSGMRELVNDLRNARVMLGTGKKWRSEEDERSLSKMEKCLWPAYDIPIGSILAKEDITIKSPTTPDGLRPYMLDTVIGKITINDLSTDAPITAADIWGEDE